MVGKVTLLRLTEGFLFGAAFLVIGIRYFQNLDHRYLQPDEHIYLREGELLELWLKGDWQNPIWDTFEVFDHPTVGAYMYGVGLYIGRQAPIKERFQTANFNDGLEISQTDKYESFGDLWKNRWWLAFGAKPLASVKHVFPERYAIHLLGRQWAVILSLIALGCLFWWFTQYFHWVLALTGVLLVAFHPLSLDSLPVAMLEAPLFLFEVIAGGLIAWWIKSRASFDRWKLGFFAGVGTSLAVGVKLTSIAIVFGLVIFLIFLAVRELEKQRKISRFLMSSGAFFGGFSITFWLLNPQLYRAPFFNLLRFYATRRNFTAWQMTHFTDTALPRISDRFMTGIEKVILGSGFVFETRWFEWVAVAAFLLGLGVLVKVMIQGLSSLETKKEEFILWWALAFFWLILSYLPENQNRYLFPLVLPTVFLQLFGVQAIITGALWLFRSRSGKEAPVDKMRDEKQVVIEVIELRNQQREKRK